MKLLLLGIMKKISPDAKKGNKQHKTLFFGIFRYNPFV